MSPMKAIPPPPRTNSWHDLKEALRQQAQTEGFSCAAFASPTPPPHADHLFQWLQQQAHGEMHWMAQQPQRRTDPRQLMENVGSILVLGVNYCPPGDPLAPGLDKGNAWISAYARNHDYHDIIKKRLKRLSVWLAERLGQPIAGRRFVDTAPLMEKPLASSAGLGWQGKNSLLVSPQFGCWLFLAAYFLPLPLPADPAISNRCGACTLCLEACPTDALAHPYRLDASRCLAYLTIEASGPIPTRYRIAMGNRVYGCDSCLAACPWNRFAPPTQEVDFLPRPFLSAPRLLDFFPWDDATFRTFMRRSPIKRSGVVRFLRNLAVALGNWGTAEAWPALAHLLSHEAPLVRGHAAWGVGRLVSQYQGEPFGSEPARLLRVRADLEEDPWVRTEIDAVRKRWP